MALFIGIVGVIVVAAVCGAIAISVANASAEFDERLAADDHEPEADAYDKVYFEGAPRPPGKWRMLVGASQALVGEQFRAVAIRSFQDGIDQTLEVRREPDNPHDKNAIGVWGQWTDKTDERRHERLGYLPRELAADIARERPSDMPLAATPYSIYRRGDFCDVKVVLLEPAAASGYWKSRGGAPPVLAPY